MSQPDSESRTWDWIAPEPLGLANAADSAGSVAGALLAGFSLTLIALIVPDTTKFRLPGLGLALVAAAAVAFIGSVQCAFWARQYAITPDDINSWYPDRPRVWKVATQRAHEAAFIIWIGRGNRCYRGAILFLLSGMTIALIPRGAIGPARGLAIGVIGLGFVLELAWIFATWLLSDTSDFVLARQTETPSRTPSTSGLATALRGSSVLARLARFFEPTVTVEIPEDQLEPKQD